MRRFYLTVQTHYRCTWKCTACGSPNRERGRIAAVDRVMRSGFTDNLYDEVQLSGELAGEKARGRFFRLQQRVNARGWLRGLSVSGVCRKCGARQFWAPAARHAWAVIAALACLALLLTMGVAPADHWLAYPAAMAASALLAEGLALLMVRWRLKRLKDPDCAPWIREAVPKD